MQGKKTHLVLSRRVGEEIEIDTGEETILLTVESIKRRQVRLSFHASPCVEIWSPEVVDKQTERRRSAEVDLPSITSLGRIRQSVFAPGGDEDGFC